MHLGIRCHNSTPFPPISQRRALPNCHCLLTPASGGVTSGGRSAYVAGDGLPQLTLHRNKRQAKLSQIVVGFWEVGVDYGQLRSILYAPRSCEKFSLMVKKERLA